MFKNILVLGLLWLSATLVFAQQESLTITTYYPSPYGSYNELSVGDIRFDSSWNPNPTFRGTEYTTVQTIQTIPVDGNNSIAIHSGSGARTALVTDGPIMSMEEGAYFAGNVGIGQTNPPYRLDVAGTARVKSDTYSGDALIVGDDSKLVDVDSEDTLGIYGIQNSARANIRLGTSGQTISGYNGGIGIGTTTPGAKLDVRDGGINTGTLIFTDSGGTAFPDNWIGMASNIDGATKWLHIGGITDASYRRIALYGDRIFMSGNVGIGTTSPEATLDIQGNLEAGADNQYYTKRSKISASNKDDISNAEATYAVVGENLANFRNVRGALGRIHRSGSTYTRAAVYGLAGGPAGDPNYAGDFDGKVRIGLYPGTTFAKLNVYNDDGYEGIAVSVTGGNAGIHSYSTRGNGIQGYSNTGSAGVLGHNDNGYGVVGWGLAGDFRATGPGPDYTSASSIRWKKNIKPLDNALERVLKLQGVYFDWDEMHGGKHDIGMVAEEVGKFFPELVTYEANGKDATGMDYSRLVTVLVEAIKEQQKEIDDLKSQIETLEKKE